MDRQPLKSQIVPIVVTIFASVLTVQYLYTITNQKEVLAAGFLLLYIIAAGTKDWCVRTLYPPRKDGKVEHRREVIVSACDVFMAITVVVISSLVFDIFISVKVKITLEWWDYIVLFSLGFTFLFFFIFSTD